MHALVLVGLAAFLAGFILGMALGVHEESRRRDCDEAFRSSIRRRYTGNGQVGGPGGVGHTWRVS